MKKNILLVEYNSETIEAINQYLNNDLFDITTAGNQNVARMLLAKRPFHMVITAALLPKSHGFTLAKYISENYPATKVIVIGEKINGSNDQEEASRCGVCEFIEKPLVEPIFRKKVLFHLGIEKSNFESQYNANSTNFMVLPPLDQLRPQTKTMPIPEDTPLERIIHHSLEDDDAFEIDLDEF